MKRIAAPLATAAAGALLAACVGMEAAPPPAGTDGPAASAASAASQAAGPAADTSTTAAPAAPAPAPATAPPSPAPAAAGEAPDNPAELESLKQADALLRQGEPARAIAVLEPMIGRHAALHAQANLTPGKTVFSASTRTEREHYRQHLADAGVPGQVLGPVWGSALFLKGYALLALEEHARARDVLEQAVALSPANAQFRTFLGQVYQDDKEWERALEMFVQAQLAVPFTKPRRQAVRMARALRGQGDALARMQRTTQARQRYQACLQLTPDDTAAAQALAQLDGLQQAAAVASRP